MIKLIDYVARFVFLACGLGLFASVGAWETEHITFLRAMVQVMACGGALLLMGVVQASICKK